MKTHTRIAVSSLVLALVVLVAGAAPAKDPAPAPPPVRVGDRAPDFSLPDDSGAPVALADLRGKRPVLLAFYPKAFTPGCTTELSELRDQAAMFEGRGVQVFGVSVDGVAALREFRAQLRLPFPLLSDEGARVSALYDAVTDIVFGRMSARKLVLIDRDGAIVYRDEAYRPGNAESLAALRAAIEKLPAP